ncbi:putative Abortive infection protein [Candidatus Promineifilum breve]|uniref:Abortive infection protein n=1 Tax=Candidatus Promineifilum breve TaxID=1806508 RepID=A0A170PK01_9CHLR|nr:CPBP family intramembrane glutamic endopeptidase [Candidatus Promineifilum breve]CUS06207.1 putative Abortive infection protein [Candidatus Promineifilum breve]
MFKRITIFYVAALLLTILLAGLQQATGLSTTFVLPQWGPGLAALLMLLLFGRDGLSLRPVWRAPGVGRYAVALALPLLGAAVLWPLATRFVAPVDLAGGLRGLSPLWLAGMLFGALGEEIGWRGYLQPVVRGRWNAAATSLLVGALWALWHVQSWANGPLFMACLVAALVGYSLAITALIDDVPGARLPLAVLFHLGINVGLSFFGDLVSQTGFMALNAAVWLGLGVVLIGLRRPASRRSPLATPHS